MPPFLMVSHLTPLLHFYQDLILQTLYLPGFLCMPGYTAGCTVHATQEYLLNQKAEAPEYPRSNKQHVFNLAIDWYLL